jgi:BASS family bile acid:Na+ symporter
VTLQALILLGLKASIVLTVLAIGLEASMREATYLTRHPRKLARSLIAMDLVMPLCALLIAGTLALPAPVKIALIVLSVSPVPPVFPKKVGELSGTEICVVGLLVMASLVSLPFVPLAIVLLGAAFGVQTHMDVTAVASVVAATVLAPLAVGIAIRHFWPGLAHLIARRLARIATVLLAVVGLVVIIGSLPQITPLIGDGSVVAFALFVIVGLVVGHVLGGPEHDDRAVLAVAASTRHPGVAIAIAAANFPTEKQAAAAVILYLLVSAICVIPYKLWHKRQAVSGAHAAASIRNIDNVKADLT